MTADTVGGVWTYALELTAALAGRDVEVTLAAMGPGLGPEQRAEAGVSRARRVYAERFRLEWMEEPWEDVERAGEWLLRIAEEVEPDVVHLNGYAHAALPWGVPVLVVGHSCVCSWHEAVRGEPAGAQWSRYREEVARGLAAADLVVAPSATMLAALARHYAFAGERLVIANGRRAPASAARAKEPLVVSAGRLWDEAKNVAAVEGAAVGLPWPVLLAGEGSQERSRGNVGRLGRLSAGELRELLARASIFAHPARYEPFGLAPLEAGLAGCALVLGEIESLREVWGDAALYVDPDDEPGLARVLRELVEDRARREAFGARARERAARYTPERMAAGYSRAYSRLYSRRPAAAAS